MKTFVIAYISFMDNELKMEKVEAESDIKACLDYLTKEWNSSGDLGGVNLTLEFPNIGALNEFCINCDSMINAIEV